MPGTIITTTSGKGGVGKTTTVVNVATALALLGKRVIAVDADIGLRNLDLVLGLLPAPLQIAGPHPLQHRDQRLPVRTNLRAVNEFVERGCLSLIGLK